MKTVILCGGRGTRLGEHGASVPKALIEIGGRPILWHLLKIYSHYGLKDFIVCLGFLGADIKRYFLEHHWVGEDVSPDASAPGDTSVYGKSGEDWKLTFVDTGLDTNTGGRVKRIEKYIGDDETFCLTYGDGLADVRIPELLEFHKAHGRLATLTAVHPHSNFGLIKIEDEGTVVEFLEKPRMTEWVNGGFFVMNRPVFDFLGDDSILEREPLEAVARERQLVAYRHEGFWKCMDTFKDNVEFNQLWNDSKADWKVWSE